jgi:hypothetical protein
MIDVIVKYNWSMCMGECSSCYQATMTDTPSIHSKRHSKTWKTKVLDVGIVACE